MDRISKYISQLKEDIKEFKEDRDKATTEKEKGYYTGLIEATSRNILMLEHLLELQLI